EILRAIASNKKYKHLSETELRGHLEIVLEYLYTTEPDIPLKDRKVNYGELEQVEKDIIELMLQGVSCDSTVATLRSSLLIDEDTDDKWQQRAIKAFKDMLDPDEGSLKNKDIANLYYLLRLSQQSENKPGPNLVLALKSLSLLRQKHENGKIVINLEAQLLNRIIAIFIDTAADAEGLVKALDKIKIPPEHQRTIKDVGETIRLKTADAVQEAIDRSLAQAANNPLLVLAGVITWGGPTAVALGLVGRGVTYKLNAGRLHKFYTYPIEGAEDLSKFRKIFKLDDSISISQIKNARIEAETIYDSITKLQTRFDILERGRLNKRGNALLSSMKKAEFERYGKRIRKLFPKSPNSAANVLMNFEPDPVKLRSVLLKSGYTAEQAKAGVKPIYLETLAERSASLARRVEEIEALPGKDRAARWKSFIDEEVRPFQRSLTEFGAEYGSEEARRMAAGRVQGIELGEGDDIWRLIQEAHSLDDVPEKFLKLLGEDFNTLSEAAKTQRIQAAKRLMRLGIVGDAPTAAVLERLATRAAPAMETMSASERLLSLRLPNTPTTRAFLEGSEGAKYYRQLAEIVEESGEAGGRRALRYLTNLPETASPAARSAEVLRLVSKMDDPLLASRTLGSLPRASSLTSAECVSAIDQLVRTGGRSVLSRAASAAGFFAVDLLFAGLEFKQAVDEIERLKQAREEAIKALDELCKAGFLKSVESGVYEGQGVVIAIDEVMDTQNTDVGRHITHGAMILGEGAAFTTLWLTSTFTGPGMIIAIPVLIGVHAGIDHIADEIGKDKRRDFINACPTWLLALLGSARAVGRNEYQIVQECEESTPPQAMVMANSPSAAGTAHQMYVEVEAEKKVSREKSFQALCFRELSFLGRSELMAYLPGGGDPRELFKPEAEFLQEDGDYWNIVRQFARLQIHAESRQDTSGDSIPLVPFEKTEKLDITDYRGSWFSDNYRPLITPQEFGDIARTSMLFYVHHRRELMYRKTIEAIQERFAGDEEYMKFEIEEFHKDIQKYPDLYYVFNMHPKDLPAWNGKTVAKQILEEKLQEMSSPERVPPTADVAATGYGIPGGEKYDLETFLSRHVEVHASSSVRVRLEQYENTHEGLPIKMVEMEQWGEDEEFFSTLKQKLQPLHDLNRELFAS
ncbi:hypothetical protein KKC44_00995, partial [Patescibacteria group bacterium]|nr:hypothetical protein [Patescibacteria group bacterium]